MNQPHASNPARITGLRVLLYSMLGLVALTAFLPIIYMVGFSTGVADPTAPFGLGGVSETAGRTVDNYHAVLTDENTDMPLYLRNTLIIAILGVGGTVISSAIVAYGFSRVRWRGRGVAFMAMLATMIALGLADFSQRCPVAARYSIL